MGSHAFTTRNGATCVKLTGTEVLYADIGTNSATNEIRCGFSLCIDPSVLELRDPRLSAASHTFFGFAKGFVGALNLPDKENASPRTSDLCGYGVIESSYAGTGAWTSNMAPGYDGSFEALTGSYLRESSLVIRRPANTSGAVRTYGDPCTKLGFSGLSGAPSATFIVAGMKVTGANQITIALNWSKTAAYAITTGASSGDRAPVDARLIELVTNMSWTGATTAVGGYTHTFTTTPAATDFLRAYKYATLQWPLITTQLQSHSCFVLALP
jgi:hypothetical protein